MTKRGHAKVLDFGLAKQAVGRRRHRGFRNAHGDGGRTAHHPGQRCRDRCLHVARTGARQPTRSAHGPVSFGVVLYEMATGALPFRGDTSGVVFEAILNRAPVAPVRLNPYLRKLEEVINRALEKDRDLRYQHASDLRAELQRLKRDTDSGRAAVAVPANVTSTTKAERRVPAIWKFALPAVVVAAAIALAVFFHSNRTSRPSRAEYVQLTNFPDSVTQPALSPEGRMLAFVRGDSTFVAPGEIYVKMLPSGEPVQLTHDNLPKMSPVFSSDGSRIAYTALDGGFDWDTWLVPVLGGKEQLWLPNASGLTWIKPQHLLFSEIKRGEHMAIVMASESRAEARDLYVPPHERGMAHRSYLSPDGNSVLVVEMDNEEWLPCRVVAFKGNSAGKQIGPAGAPCTNAAWSPDGRWIYVSAHAGDNFHIWRQGFPDGQPEQITSGPTEEEGIAMDPDGGSFITSVGLRQRTVSIRDAHGEHQISVEGYAYLPRFSPDGKKLYYRILKGGTSPFLGASELWVADLASGHNEPLMPGLGVTSYNLSHDGRRVVFSAVDADGNSHIWLASPTVTHPRGRSRISRATCRFSDFRAS